MDLRASLLKHYLPACIAISLALAYLGVVVLEFATKNDQTTSFAVSTNTIAPKNSRGEPNSLARIDIQQLSEMRLFGTYSPAVEPPEPKPIAPPKLDLSKLPKTKVNLKLSGIGFTNNNERAYAIIVTPDGQHDHFVIGEEIVPKVSVHLIEQQRVIVSREGNLEVLELPRTNSANSIRPNRNTQIARNNNRNPNNTRRN